MDEKPGQDKGSSESGMIECKLIRARVPSDVLIDAGWDIEKEKNAEPESTA